MKPKYGTRHLDYFDKMGFVTGVICAEIVATRADYNEERNFFDPSSQE